MGQKSNPIILRLNKTNQHWNSCWYSDDDYATPFLQDCKINGYMNSSQQQLKRFSPVFFIKRQRGDLQIALFSAKPAQQFSKFKHNKHRNFISRASLITHNIFKKLALDEKSTHKDDGLYDGFSSSSLGIPIRDPLKKLMSATKTTKKEYFRFWIFLAIISSRDALKFLLDHGSKVDHHVLYKKDSFLPIKKGWRLPNGGENLINLTGINKTTPVKFADPTKTHLEYSIYKYYNEHRAPFAPVRSKLFLIKSPSIYHNPLFLASQVVSLLEERAVFRQIKHRIVREIRKNPIVKGVRIICSGRVASRSKKAQKARRESIQWGATSLNVFSEHVNFAHSFAQTTFGKIGVKVWISYNLGTH